MVAHEDAGAVAIEGQRQPVGGAERVKQGAVAVQVLGGAEDQGQAGAGSVVDRPMQGQDRAAVLEPGEEAGVELQEGAHLSFGRAAGADLTAAPAAGGGPPERAAEAPHRAAAQRQPIHLLELLGDVAVIQPGVGPLQERSRPRAHRGGQAAGRRAAPQAMAQAPHPLGREAALHPVKLSDAQLHGQRDPPGQGGLEQPGPRHFLAAHRECLPCLHGVTFLLNS